MQKDNKISKTDKQFVRDYLTVQVVKYRFENDDSLRRIINPDLVEYLKAENNNEITVNEILTRYLRKQPDTIRKNIKAAQRILLAKSAEVD